MNKNIALGLMMSIGFMTVACTKQEPAPHTDTASTVNESQTSVAVSEPTPSSALVTASQITPTTHVTSWQGEYTGTLPCADCEGIKTELFLFKNRTYKMKSTYLGKSDQPFIIEGKLTLKNNEFTIITLHHHNEKTMYQVRGEKLLALDQEGHIIEGELASHYILEKVKPHQHEM